MSELGGRFPLPALSGVCAVLCQNPAGPGIKEQRSGITRAPEAVIRGKSKQSEEPKPQGAHMERTGPQQASGLYKWQSQDRTRMGGKGWRGVSRSKQEASPGKGVGASSTGVPVKRRHQHGVLRVSHTPTLLVLHCELRQVGTSVGSVW